MISLLPVHREAQLLFVIANKEEVVDNESWTRSAPASACAIILMLRPSVPAVTFMWRGDLEVSPAPISIPEDAPEAALTLFCYPATE